MTPMRNSDTPVGSHAPDSGQQAQDVQELGASKYGLRGEFSAIVLDRGEKIYHEDPANTIIGPDNRPLTLEELPKVLRKAKVDSFHEKYAYIPRKDLDRIMSYSQVFKIIPELKGYESLSLADRDGQAREICSRSPSSSSPRIRLLAALVAVKHHDLFAAAVVDGVSDYCLPLKYDPQDQEQSIVCQIEEHNHSIFDEELHSYDPKALIDWTRAVTAPYIKQLPNKHYHYVLEHGDHLPMKSAGQVLQNLETNDISVIPASAKPNPSIYLAHGGFAKVFKVQIYPGHWNFGGKNGDMSKPEGAERWFALKQLNDNDANSFEMELKSLLYCLHHKFMDDEVMQEGRRHMVHVRASMEVRNHTNKKTDYYFLFDWQDGNLSQFWKSQDQLRYDADYQKCMAKQFFGLAAALLCVHNDRGGFQASNPDRNKHTVYGRHGDLVPSNILYSITENGEHELKLADFGLGQLHGRMSRSYGNATFTPRTETYGAPDFSIQGGCVSRATDIFSFGCVMLEHITWYLLGNEEVQAFSDRRMENDPQGPGFFIDTYYRVVSHPSGTQEASLKKPVTDHILELMEHLKCSWYFKDMLDLIHTRMLSPDNTKRISSGQLTKKLDALRKVCELDSSYYSGCWKSENLDQRSLDSSISRSDRPRSASLRPAKRIRRSELT